MGKHGKYKKKYRKEWEKEEWTRGWLREANEVESSNNLNGAYCEVCKVALRAHHADLKKHQASNKHQQAYSRLRPLKQPILNKFVHIDLTKEQKINDLKMAAYIASHCSVQSIDHLNEIMQQIEKSSMKMHRTKCSGLIKNVISPSLLEQLILDLGDKKFSLIIDESTDNSTQKFLCICIRFYNERLGDVKTDFLVLLMLENGTADNLYVCIVKFLEENKINIKNMIGIGTDRANSLCGQHHSLFTLLREKNQDLQLIRCVCHSLHNACSHAAEELPANVDFLCREIYSWFSHSSNRKIDYKKTWDLININENVKFHNFVQIGETRWLSRYKAVKVVLEHWLELKTHFSFVVQNQKCFTARLISEMLNDDSNVLFFIILKPILHDINCLNLCFQKQNVDVGGAYDDLCKSIMFVAEKIMTRNFVDKCDLNIVTDNINNDLAYRKPEHCDFGIEYYNKLKTVQKDSLKTTISEIELRSFKYLKRLLEELIKRLPSNLKMFKNLKSFLPKHALNQLNKLEFRNLPFVNIFVKEEDMYKCDVQWKKLHLVPWTDIISNDKLENTCDFWIEVLHYTDAGGTFVFKELANYILCCLSLPSSNAVVERAFLIMNTVKTKFRNRMQQKMLESIMRIRITFYSHRICCLSFPVTEAMLQKFKSREVYAVDNIDVECMTDYNTIDGNTFS